MDEPWYGAKCLFLHGRQSRVSKIPCYEERITLIRARSFEGAIRKAEAEARRYAAGLGECEYLGFVEVFHLFDRQVKEGSEVFSIMRSIRLPKRKFIDRFYDDGTFHDQRREDRPRLKPRRHSALTKLRSSRRKK
jgi:uncharacterized protein DUF4288